MTIKRNVLIAPGLAGALGVLFLAGCGSSKTTAPVAVTELSVTTPVAAIVAGTVIVPPIVVTAKDAGTAAADFSGAVTLALDANPGGAVLSGTLTVNAINGVATFNNLSLNRAASGYTLVASEAAVIGRSGTFSIEAATASALAKSAGDNQSGRISTTLPESLSVTVTDAFGNAVPGVTVTWGVTAGGGTLSRPTSAVGASGTASVAWTLGATAGTQNATATVTGLAGSPVTFTATGTVTAASAAATTPP